MLDSAVLLTNFKASSKSGDISQLSTLLSPLIANASEVYTDTEMNSPFLKLLKNRDSEFSEFQKLVKDSRVKSSKPIMNELRMFKSEAEVTNMRLAGKISGRAIT